MPGTVDTLMPSNSKIRSGTSLHLMALLLLVTVVTFHVPLAQPLTDPFQEAEYAMFGFLAQIQADLRMPVLIHGGLDTVPSRVAALTCAADAQIVCVRTINALIQFGASCLFVAVLAVLGGLGSFAALVASLPAAAMLWFYNGSTTRVVDAHQGTPSVRDLFVMAALLPMARLCRQIDAGDARDRPYSLLALGVLAGIGVFWAYNRGLVLILVLGAFVAGLCLLRQSLRPALPTLAGIVVGLAAMLAVGGGRIITDTLFNISYWSRNEAIWRTYFEEGMAVPVVALMFLVLAGTLPIIWASLRSGRPGRALMLTVLGLTFGLYAVQSLNRPDLQHLRWIIWPATLMLAIIIRDQAGCMRDGPAWPGATLLALFPLLSVLCIEFYSENSIVRVILPRLVENARTMTRALPGDRELVGRDLARVAELVTASGHCTFAANNAGIVHLLSRMPPCSRFVFGTYIATDRQTEVIADLEAAQPEIILWDSASWWSRIDGRSFRDRTPMLADWIEARYPVRTVIGQHVLLSRALLEH